MVYRTTDRAGRRDFWQRVIDYRRVGFGWALLILAIFPLLAYISIRLSYLAGGPENPLTTVRHVAAQPLMLIPMLLYGLIAGPIAEELGWRGFALDALLSRLNTLIASTVLGIFWWAWHLPLFFIVGTSQHTLGIGTLAFWQFLLTPLPLSVLITWVYLHTRRSILSAGLMHLGFNLSANLFYPLSPQATIIHMGLMLALAAAVILPGRQGKWLHAA
jgi:membrane protease YdiL (CAAX protease family)